MLLCSCTIELFIDFDIILFIYISSTPPFIHFSYALVAAAGAAMVCSGKECKPRAEFYRKHAFHIGHALYIHSQSPWCASCHSLDNILMCLIKRGVLILMRHATASLPAME